MFVVCVLFFCFFFFKQKTAYEMRISDWSSDVCFFRSQPRDVLFIDEIHRLSPAVEGVLYPAMEDFHLDLIIGEGPAAHSVRIDLPPFTLVGATTRSGLINTPLRGRFGIPLRLQFYATDELALCRKAGGWGKSLSYGVDLGGGRNNA